MRLPAIAIIIVLATTGAFSFFRQPTAPDSLYTFPDDGQTWIAIRAYSTTVGEGIEAITPANQGISRLEVTTPDGSVEVIDDFANPGYPDLDEPLRVSSAGPAELCRWNGSLLQRCDEINIQDGTIYEFWGDTDQVFTTTEMSNYRVRDGLCVDVFRCAVD